MRRKILQDFANTLCQMLVGWRMANDLEALAALPDGSLSINLLTGTSSHSSGAALDLYISHELQAWLLHRLSGSKIEFSAILEGTIVAAIRTDRIATSRKRIISFDFEIESVLKTSEREYRGVLREVHKWHTRVPSTKTIKPPRGELGD